MASPGTKSLYANASPCTHTITVRKYERLLSYRKEMAMKKGDVIELRTIDKGGFISFKHLKIKDARVAKRLLRDNDYHPMGEPNTYFCSHQYEKGGNHA